MEMLDYLRAVYARLLEDRDKAPGGAMGPAGQGINMVAGIMDTVIATLEYTINPDAITDTIVTADDRNGPKIESPEIVDYQTGDVRPTEPFESAYKVREGLVDVE